MAVWERGTVCGCVVMHSMTSIMSLSTLIEEQRSMMPLLSLSLCSSRRRICLMLLAQTVIHQHISLADRCCHGNCQTEVLDQKTFITSFPSPFSPSLLVDVIFSFNFFSFHFYSSDWLFSSIICSFSFSCLFSFFSYNPHSLNWLHYSLLSTCSWRVVSTLVPFFMVAIYEFVQWDSYKNVWSL